MGRFSGAASRLHRTLQLSGDTDQWRNRDLIPLPPGTIYRGNAKKGLYNFSNTRAQIARPGPAGTSSIYGVPSSSPHSAGKSLPRFLVSV